MNGSASILELPPEQVFRPEWVGEYRRRLDVVGLEIAKVGDRLFLFNRLREFPADLLLRATPPPHSWGILVMSVFESLVLAIWRVALDDTSPDGLTVRQLRNQVMQNLRTVELKNQLADELRAREFDQKLNSFEDRVRSLRSNTIAHLNLDERLRVLEGANPSVRLREGELAQYASSLKDFFDGICFGTTWSLLSAPYLIPSRARDGAGQRTDIALLLNDIARGSPVLNMPEQAPENWEVFRTSLSQNNRRALDEWRARVGLAPLNNSTLAEGAS